MKIFRNIPEYRRWRSMLPRDISIGFIPTMGALHDGHASLIRNSCAENKITVVSIFVNPIQFDNINDLKTYPQNFETDLEICRNIGVDAVFMPDAAEVYTPNHSTYCDVEKLGMHLCGAARPGHFKGVCTVVLKLFNIIESQTAYFGQKDIQQARIIQQMCEDLNINIMIKINPTIREKSGLAMSSRNLRLSAEQTKRAQSIFRGLKKAGRDFNNGVTDSRTLMQIAEKEIQTSTHEKIDYISIVDLKTLQPVETVNTPAVIAAAVYYGDVRMIDNIILDGSQT